jgi:membrane protein implicated in regulation of membrane protease activity
MDSDSVLIIGSLLIIIGILGKDIFIICLGSFIVFIAIISYINTCTYNYNVITNVNSIEESDIEQL